VEPAEERWERRKETMLAHAGVLMNKSVMVAWVAGYVLALEDVKFDIKQLMENGGDAIEGALEEVEVSLAAALKVQAITDEWN
jgi:hypothetical protein